MTRDYKDSTPGSGVTAKANTFLIGLVSGVVLGLGIALGVAWFINKTPSPFRNLQVPEATAPANTTTANTTTAPASSAPTTTTAPTAQQPYDFYRILPGNNDAATPTKPKPTAATPTTSAAPATTATNTPSNTLPAGIYYLQIAALQSPADADGLKGKLALLGIPATIQTVTMPDKGTLYRVRTGPYKTPAELDTARATLNQNNYSPTLVKGP